MQTTDGVLTPNVMAMKGMTSYGRKCKSMMLRFQFNRSAMSVIQDKVGGKCVKIRIQISRLFNIPFNMPLY
jgi:hypothetical protein